MGFGNEMTTNQKAGSSNLSGRAMQFPDLQYARQLALSAAEANLCHPWFFW